MLITSTTVRLLLSLILLAVLAGTASAFDDIVIDSGVAARPARGPAWSLWDDRLPGSTFLLRMRLYDPAFFGATAPFQCGWLWWDDSVRWRLHEWISVQQGYCEIPGPDTYVPPGATTEATYRPVRRWNADRPARTETTPQLDPPEREPHGFVTIEWPRRRHGERHRPAGNPKPERRPSVVPTGFSGASRFNADGTAGFSGASRFNSNGTASFSGASRFNPDGTAGFSGASRFTPK